MCGIAGFLGRGDEPALRKMIRSIHHRGPDQENIFIENNVFLAHARLNILDIAGGIQPMWNADESIGVIFNGEIFNYQDLKTELIQAGHQFRTTHSDTEVLIHGDRKSVV